MTQPLWQKSEEEQKSLLMKVKVKQESEKASQRFNIYKTKIMTSNPVTSWQIDEKTMETVREYYLGLQNYCRW